MVQDVTSRIQDSATGAGARVSDQWGDLNVLERTPMLNEHFDSTTLETGKWFKQEGSGGTVSIASKIATFSTSTASTGLSALDSVRRFTPLCGTALLFRVVGRFGTAPASGNKRQIGFRNDAETTKLYAELGTSFNFKADASGVNKESDSMAGVISPSALTFFVIEILWSHEIGRCFLNGVPAGEIALAGRSDLHLDTNTMRAFIANDNDSGSTDHKLYISEASVWLLGNLSNGPTRRHDHTGGADSQVMLGAGILERVIRRTANGETFEILDGTSTSGSVMVENSDFASGAGAEVVCNHFFADGIYWNTTGGSADDFSLFIRGIG